MELRFLREGNRELLVRAAARSHQLWFARRAAVAGGQVRQADGAPWTHTPGQVSEVFLAFPSLREESASRVLDELVDRWRGLRPLHQIAVWCEGAGEPWDLGARLLARGFQWGWQPHWMALDLPSATECPSPEGVVIREASGEDTPCLRVPYSEPGSSRITEALCLRRPQRVWCFEAWMDGRRVGRSLVSVGTGPLGVAGIFDVGVAPEAQNRGIGRALSWAACRVARDLGCRFAVLNATPLGEVIYRKLGFQSLGYGQTWWMREADLSRETLRFPRPSAQEVAFIEAVGRGDLDAMNALGGNRSAEDLRRPIFGRQATLTELAQCMKQPASVEWLVARGVPPPGVSGG
ncbi:MAG TPA: GNAT family N-acetyltransferase [Armatimonadota bacterium]|jgi:GNAT superfamily N-acetyltransferase